MKGALIAVALLVLLAAGVGRKYTGARRVLRQQSRTMSDAWTDVDGILSKHAAAISDLMEGVKPALETQPGLEREIREACAVLQNGEPAEAKIRANARLNAAAAKLLLISDMAPKWKSDRGLARMESELADAESEIAVPRRKYNEALEHYNAQIQQFPENLVASLAGLKRNDAYFKAELGEQPPGQGK